MPRSAQRRVPRARLAVPLLLLPLVAGAGLAVADQGDGPAARSVVPAVDRGRPAPDLGELDLAEREAGVLALLEARGAAVRARDRAAFLATVDPEQPVFRDRQAALFDALEQVPLQTWQYVLDPDREQPRDARLDAEHGPGWWAPDVTLRYRLRGFDDQPTLERQALTLVERDGRWLVAADDDFEDNGAATTRGLWDAGPVVAVQRRRVLVLGHEEDRQLLDEIARTAAAAVPRVTGFWGEDWAQRVVVLVPGGQEELRDLVPGDGDLSQVAAVATAEVAASPGGLPVGDRIVVNPATFQRLGAVGRRVVLTHETAHVATRSATGAYVPAWFVEGLADHVGYLGTDVPLRVAARDLRAAVRAGRVPAELPADGAFDGGAADLAQAYEQAWLAVELLVERYGEERVVELYRAVGRAGSAEEVDAAFAEHVGTTAGSFTRAWRAWLVDRLA